MSAETLREAAALMRERAEGRTGRTAPGPYSVKGDWSEAGMLGAHIHAADGSAVAYVTRTLDDAEHIASWHPAVALAGADWLESAASGYVEGEPLIDAALAFARTYLGESA